MSLERGPDLDDRLERLIENAFEADAEDFEQSEPSDDVVEIEVRYIRYNPLPIGFTLTISRCSSYAQRTP